MKLNKKQAWIWVIPGILIMTWLVVPWLNYDAIWFDEYRTLFRTGSGRFPDRTISNWLSYVIGMDSTWPPLYYAILSIWDFLVFPDPQFTSRILSFYFGCLTIAMMYRATTDLFDPITGVVSVILLSSSPILIHYAHELRPYTMWILLTIAMIWAYWRNYHRTNVSTLSLWILSIATALYLYTHSLSTILVGAIGLFHLLQFARMRNRYKWKKTFQHLFIGGVLFAPWIGILIVQTLQESSSDRPGSVPEAIAQFIYLGTNSLYILALPLFMSSIFRFKQQAVQFLLTIFVIALIALICAQYLLSFYYMRYLVFLLPLLLLIIARMLISLYEYLPVVAVGILIAWVINGGLLIGQRAAPTYLADIPLRNMQHIQQVASECTFDDDLLMLGVTLNEGPEGAEFLNVPVFSYYLYPNNAQFSLIDNLPIIDLEAADNLDEEIPPSYYPVDESFDLLLDNTAHVWILTDPEIQQYEDVNRLMNELQYRNYMNCGAFLERDQLLGEVWAKNPERCQTLIDRCSISP